MKKNLKNIFITKRPWGSFTSYIKNEKATVKIIKVAPGESLSLQYHNNRSEFWHIISGEGIVIVDKKKYIAKKDKEFSVPPKTLHRIEAKTELVLLEIATGKFDEEDIVRKQDKYGRINPKKITKK